MKREIIFEIFQLFSEVYPNFDFDQNKINTWSRLLKDQDPETVKKNAEIYALNNKFPPSISDLRDIKKEAHSNDFLKKIEKWRQEASGPRELRG